VSFPRLYVIVDDDVGRAHGWTVPALARACLEGGARLLQVRAKAEGAAELLDLCEQVAAEAARFAARLVVNDRADVARLVKGAGVHVGQDDLPPAFARQLLGPEAIVGVSTHTPDQVEAALREPVSYLAVGPVFGSHTKETGYDAVGLALVRYAAKLASRAIPGGRAAPTDDGPGTRHPHQGPGTRDQGPVLPVVAIGGITLDLARSVIEAGAASVAVISDVLATGDPTSRVRAYVELLT
jgi:thiamine-phosphate pyrophosphorylase